MVIKISSRKFLRRTIFMMKLPVICFTCVFATVIISSFAILITLSITDIKVNSPYVISAIKKAVNSRFNQFNIDFSSFELKKKSVRNMKLDFTINDIVVRHTKQKIEVVKFDKLKSVLPIRELFYGAFIPSIGDIKNKTFNIPISSSSIVGKTEKYKNIQDNFTEAFRMLIVQFNNAIRGAGYTLNNGISIENAKFNFINTQNQSKFATVNLVKSYSKVVETNSLTKQQKKDLANMMERLRQQNNDNRIIAMFKKIYSKIVNFSSKHIEKAVIHNSVIKYSHGIFTIQGLCNMKHGKIDGCIFNVSDFPVDAFSLMRNINSKVNIAGKLYGSIYVKMDNDGAKLIDIDSKVKPKKTVLHDSNQRDINEFNFKVNAVDNFTKIKSIDIFVEDVNKYNKRRTMELKAIDLVHENTHFVDGKVDVIVNNIHLSEFYEYFTKKVQIGDDVKHFDGLIEGTLSFKIDKEGKLVPLHDDKSKVRLKNLIINSKTFAYDLSNLLFSLEVLDNNIVLKMVDVDNDKLNKNAYLTLRFDIKKQILIIEMHDFTINKTSFDKIKKLIFNEAQYNFAKPFQMSFMVNGKAVIPLNSSFVKNGELDLKFLFLTINGNEEEEVNDNKVLSIKKKVGTKIGDIEMDFGTAKMYSTLYDFMKERNDKSVIKGKIDFAAAKPFGIKIDADWKFNGKKVSDFGIMIEKDVKLYLTSENINLKVYSTGVLKNVFIEIFGQRAYIDDNFWRLLLLLIVMIDSDGDIRIKIDMVDGKIKDLFLRNVLLDMLIRDIYFYGHFDLDVEYDNKFYEGYHYINENGKFETHLPNIIPLFILGDMNIKDLPISRITVDGQGIENGNNTSDAKMDVEMQYKTDKSFDFTRVNKAHIENLNMHRNGITATNADVNGDWFDALVDFSMLLGGPIELDGRLVVLTPAQRIKKFFSSNRKLTKNNSAHIVKKGDNMKEFIKHMEINGKDFSANEKGEQNFSWDMISEVMSDEK